MFAGVSQIQFFLISFAICVNIWIWC